LDTHTKKHTYTENITAQIKSTSLAVVVVVFVFVAFAVVVFLLFPLCRCTGRGDESPPDILTTEPARKLERWRAVVLAALLLRSIKKNYFFYFSVFSLISSICRITDIY